MATLCFKLSCEHSFGIDGKELTPAAGEDGSVRVAELSAIVKGAAFHANGKTLDDERLMERHGAKILDLQLASEGHFALELESLAHAFVKNGCDDSAVGVTWRSGEVRAKLEVAEVTLAAGAEDEVEVEAVGVGGATSKTDVALPTFGLVMVVRDWLSQGRLRVESELRV